MRSETIINHDFDLRKPKSPNLQVIVSTKADLEFLKELRLN